MFGPAPVWVGLSHGAAVLSAVGAVVGLLAPERIYGRETAVLADAATAQDLVQLIVVAPLLLVLGSGALRGGVGPMLAWFGCLAFTAYNYAIYAFSIHFGPLFLVWTTVLGLSTYAVVGAVAGIDAAAVKRRFGARAQPVTGWALIVLAVLFGLLWLSEIARDLAAGSGSSSAEKWRVPTDPVHVLDLAVFLPAELVGAVLLLRRAPLGYVGAVGALVFLALTCLPILLTPAVAMARGRDTSWSVLLPIGIVLVVSLGVLTRTLVGLRPRTRPAAGR